MRELLQDYIRSSDAVTRACARAADESWLALADSWYGSAEAFLDTNKARHRYLTWWGDRAAVGRL